MLLPADRGLVWVFTNRENPVIHAFTVHMCLIADVAPRFSGPADLMPESVRLLVAGISATVALIVGGVWAALRWANGPRK